MLDYMKNHASAYPPPTWAFLVARKSELQSEPPRTSNNEVWNEMTRHYEQSMAEREHLKTSRFLSKTATADNVKRMSAAVKEKYHQPDPIAFEAAANIADLPEITARFAMKVDRLSMVPMKTIPEGAIRSNRQANEKERLQIEQAMSHLYYYQVLQKTDHIEKSFRQLEVMTFICDQFIRTPVDEHPRARWAQICHLDKEVNDHVARVAYARQQLMPEVAQLRNFLRGQLFDEYCLMRGTPMEEKNETWLQYGKYLGSGLDENDGEVGRRLDRILDASGLEPCWVMDQIEDYCTDNEHIGRWQGYVKNRRWDNLAAKLSKDIQQLEKINSSIDFREGRGCKIMANMRSTKEQYFKRLEGADDFEVSDQALKRARLL